MKKLLLIAATLLVGSSHVAVAGKNTAPALSPVVPVDLPFYIGVGGVWSITSLDCPCKKGLRKYDNSNFGGIVRIGYDFNPYFGIEGRVLKSKFSKRFAETTHYGLYLKPQYHITDAINVYALIGYGHTRVDTTCKTPLYDQNGMSFGAGLEYDFQALPNEQGDAETGWGLFVDYQNLLWDKGVGKVRSNIVSAGITYDF
jgi:opacity protein-like surface antigen